MSYYSSDMQKVVLWLFSSWLYFGGSYLAMAAGDSSGRELDQTPTWAVAVVCTVFILISISLEKILHKLGTWLGDKEKKALLEALEKVKAELMILGFISLLLTFGQTYIVKICIDGKITRKMLPCPYKSKDKKAFSEGGNGRRLLSSDFEGRYLAADSTSFKCANEGEEPLLSVNGLHQIHILIFFLAIVHVLYSAVTMLLGRLKIRGWKAWEEETNTNGYEFAYDASRFRLTHETSFVRAHATSFWTRVSIFFYIGCFFRQFHRSVRKVDYLTLRNGFITMHLAPGTKFNFQKYIKRSLEDDFKVVVGVSPALWASVVIFLLLNVKGWHTALWASLIPPVIILLVGLKLQVTLAKMAIELTDRHAVVQGMPVVQGSDKYFWFGRPQLVLDLIHFALFQNAFQITYVLWIWYSFGLDNCFHVDYRLAIIKLAIGVIMICLCSYFTLPLYALVAQMGSRMKKSIFDEQTSKALKKWHKGVVKNKKHHHGVVKLGGNSTHHDKSMDGSTNITNIGSTVHSASNSPMMHHHQSTTAAASSGPTLHRFKTTGHSTTRSSSTYEQHQEDEEYDDHYDMELTPLSTNLIVSVDHHRGERQDKHASAGETNQSGGGGGVDFSFVKHDPMKRSTT